MFRIFQYVFLIFLFNQLSFLFLNYVWFTILCSISLTNLNSIQYFAMFSTELLSTMYLILESDIFISNFIIFTTYFIPSILNSLHYLFLEISPNTSSYIHFYFQPECFSDDIIYCIYFDTKVTGNSSVYFYVLQPNLFVVPGETTLCFFRLYNSNSYSVSGFSIYTIFPFDFTVFINKIQCFCFEEVLLFPFETLELPILFYLLPDVKDSLFEYTNEITLEYLFIIH